MNLSDIMAEAVLSTENPCLVAHKLKSSDAACAVLCFAYRQIRISETQFACIQSKD